MNKSVKKNTSNNYDKTYFDWQIDSGKFGGIANTYLFKSQMVKLENISTCCWYLQYLQISTVYGLLSNGFIVAR